MEKDKGVRDSTWDRATPTRSLQNRIHVARKGAVPKQRPILSTERELDSSPLDTVKLALVGCVAEGKVDPDGITKMVLIVCSCKRIAESSHQVIELGRSE